MAAIPVLPPGFSICPLGPGDLGYILRSHGLIYAREYGFSQEFDLYVLRGLADFANACPDTSRIWTARRGDEPAGSIAIVDAGGGAAQLRWFLVEPGARGLGLGRALLETALAFAGQAGFATVFLWTLACLPAARALYGSYGFRLGECKQSLVWGQTLTEERFEKSL
jgi:GNAT superfamily N-acetyltransferase